MNPHRKSDRTAPLLLLLLFLFAMYCMGQLVHLRGSSSIPSKNTCYVQVAGDVGRPGVHAFSRAPSLEELIARAGIRANGDPGPDPRPVFSSGDRLVVKREGEKTHFSRADMNGYFKMALGIPLSINTESETGLTALPEIGPNLARTIVEERSKRRGFKRLEDLITVPGIGQNRFLKIKPFIQF